LFGLVLEPTWLYETRPAPSGDRLLFAPAPPYAPTFVRPAEEYVGIDVTAAEALLRRDALLADAWLCETDWLVDVEALREADALADTELLTDIELLAEIDDDSLAEAAAVESLCAVEPPAASDVPDSLDAVEGVPEAEDSLPESGFVELLVDSDAAESLVDCEVDWDVDSVADSVPESLVAPVLPGLRTVLPSVASVWRFAAVTS